MRSVMRLQRSSRNCCDRHFRRVGKGRLAVPTTLNTDAAGFMVGTLPPSLAMTAKHISAIPRPNARVLPNRFPRNRGSGECRVRAAPAVSCARLCEETHTSIQVQRKHSGIPRAMALRIMPRSPRRRIRLVTVIGGLKVLSNPVGFATPPPI